MLVGCSVLAVLGFFMFFGFSAADSKCSRNCSLVGFSSNFRMVQHQLRGVISILDDCSFMVSSFDMIEGVHVHWWGAQGDDFKNLTNGFIISEQSLNKTYKNESFVLPLLNNYTWGHFKVLGVWDSATASDLGHVLLGLVNGAEVLNGTASTPSPSPTVINPNGATDGSSEPVMFDNCMQLAPNYRFRWTLDNKNEILDIGLEAAISERQYMAFGWAKPGSSTGFMLNADVTVVGFTSEGLPFAHDYYITKYSECVISKDELPAGVCGDFLFSDNDGNANSNNNTKLVYSHRSDGVSLICYQRPLQSPDKLYDVLVDATKNIACLRMFGEFDRNMPSYDTLIFTFHAH